MRILGIFFVWAVISKSVGFVFFFFFFLWHKNYLCMRDNSMDFVENIQFYEPKDSKMFKGLSRTHHEAILSSHRRTEESRERVKEFFFAIYYSVYS